jgi:aminoglycoside phosphotransferase (APT) family kinase protein
VSGARRPLAEIDAALQRWLAHRWPDRPGIVGRDLQRASAGHANETLFCTVTWEGGHEELVLRLPPLMPSFPDRDPLAEGRLLAALSTTGLPVPAPVAIEEDGSWFGAPFLVLPRLPGRAPGEVVVFDEWLTAGGAPLQAALHRGFVATLAAIHAQAWPEPSDVPASPLATEVQRWRVYLDWAAGDGPPDPALVDAMSWVVEHQPTSEPTPSLTWGDARLGNLLVDETSAAVLAVLDWELAAPGPAELDLGWHLALDELQARFVGSTLPGFPDRAGTVAAWEAAAGREAVDLEWHEIFALVRSTAIHDRQGGDIAPIVRWIAKKIERVG